MKQESKSSMTSLQKWGGAAALYEALAYIIGIVGFVAVVNISENAGPVQKVATIVENQGVLSMLYLIVYVAWGAMLVVLSLALHERLQGHKSAVARTATAFGIIWAVLVIASGMIYNVGMETAVSQSTLYQLPPDSGPQNQFGGGHGFTGLNYSYAPDSTAELQYWCAVN